MQSGAYSAEFLTAALQCAEVGVWYLDSGADNIIGDGVVESLLGQASPLAIETLLQSVAQQDQAKVIDFFQPRDRPVAQASIEFRIIDPNGNARWIHCFGCTPAGKLSDVGMLGGILRDITARKEAELRLQESQRQLNTLIDNLQGIAYRSEAVPPWRILFISKGVTDVTGYDAAELHGDDWTWAKLFHPDDLAATCREVEAAIAEHRPFRLSYRLKHKSGAVRWVQERGEAVYDEQGRPLFLEGLISDISDLVHSQAVLRQSKEFLEVIIEGTTDGIFLKDYANEGRYVLVNSALGRMSGLSASNIIGRTDNELFLPEEAREYREQDRTILEKGLPSLTVEQTQTSPLGQRLIETRKFPFRSDEGKYRYILGIARDLTEQRALEIKVQKMHRMDAIGQLTGGIAHDFNNLLAIILGYGELLRESLPDPSLTGLTDKIIEATERGSALVRRLLVFARKQRLESHALNLNDRLPGVVDLLRRTLGENIHIELMLSPDLWDIRVDPSQIDDALVNLSINARDAMPEGGLLTIRTQNERLDEEAAARLLDAEPGEYVVLAVSDTGHGMDSETLARVFEPFFTTKEQGRGTGLGLPMVYGFVQQSGGHVDIESAPGNGTTVKLYFPRVIEQASIKKEDAVAQEVMGGSETILVVEDNESVRAMATQQLRRLGYHVLEAADGAEALAVIDKGMEVDLVFTDIVMPGGMSGYQLAERIWQLRPDLRILFTTGYDSPATSQPPGKLSGDNLLYKPYRRYELANAIRRALDRRNSTKPAAGREE